MMKEEAEGGQMQGREAERQGAPALREVLRGVGGETGCVSAQSVTRVAVQSMCFHTATWSAAKPLIRSVRLQTALTN